VTASSVSELLSPLQRDFLRAFATRPSGFFLSGGAVLVGWVLAHRRTDDLDLFTIEDGPMHDADRLARSIAADVRATVEARQTSPDFRRYTVRRGAEAIVVDFIRERVPQLREKIVREGIPMDPVEEIVANKICALLGRAELRDVVDLYCLDQAGHHVDEYLEDAQQKDGGVTPAALAWVLSELAIPDVLPGDTDAAAVREYVRDLESRMRRLAVPPR
jgi:nucleotidyltransferase AbiEii toxin of type IV toxin-antitoxin system